MKKTKYLLVVLLAFLSLGLFSGCTSSDKLYVALSPDYAPHEFVNKLESGQNRYVGADVELAKYIAKKQNKELVIEAMGFSETLSAVQNGRVELAISGFTYKESRAENYEMSISYYDDGDGTQGLIVLKENEEKYSTLASLNHENILVGAQEGSVQADYVSQQLPNAKMEHIDTINNGIQYLLSGKIDALAIASNAADSVITNNQAIAKVAENFDVTGKTGLFALAKKGNKELIALVNEAIKEVKEQDLYSTWLEDAKKLFESLGDNAAEEDMTSSDYQPNFFEKLWSMFTGNFGDFMQGLGITLALSLLGVLFASIFGALLCLMKISKSKVLNAIASTYIEIIRGIPLLLQLTVIFLVMPRGMPKFITCVIALVINSAAYQAEIFRSGIQAVDKGQLEAARSLGMSYPKAMIKVILPQAIRNILPSLGNEFVSLIKETSLASTFYVGDLMTIKSIITSATYDSLTPYVIIAIIYFVITFSLSKLIKHLEKRIAY